MDVAPLSEGEVGLEISFHCLDGDVVLLLLDLGFVGQTMDCSADFLLGSSGVLKNVTIIA